MFGKALKWTLWASFAFYLYHLYLVVKHKKPEEAFLANPYFLDAAGFTKYNYEMLTILLTRPPVDKILLDRPQLPPGYQHPKVLVLNLNDTLIHSEYKFGVGFELLKRPGLTIFLNTMARNYEVVVFGDQEMHVSILMKLTVLVHSRCMRCAGPTTANNSGPTGTRVNCDQGTTIHQGLLLSW